MSGVGDYIERRVREIKQQLSMAGEIRAYRASNVLQNSLNEVLRGERSGRTYGYHVASAPGEPPANWHGTLRGSFSPKPTWTDLRGEAKIESSLAKIPQWMESGTPGGKIAPRPYRRKVIEDAKPEIVRIFTEPY